MGNDFIRKAAPIFKKSWDRHKVKLATPDLFTEQLENSSRTMIADIFGRCQLEVNEQVTVQMSNDGELIAMKGLSKVANFIEPPSEIIEAVRKSHGVASGTVKKVHGIANMVDICLC